MVSLTPSYPNLSSFRGFFLFEAFQLDVATAGFGKSPLARYGNSVNSLLEQIIIASVALLLPQDILNAASLLVVEKAEGPVTATEIQSFKNFMNEMTVPTNNIHNAMVYGGAGSAVESLGAMFEISGDHDFLNRMLVFTDAMLAARNDPKTGIVIWTGQRELIWPNAVIEKGKASGFSTENGDIVGHIAYAAELVLQNPKLWNAKIPDGDPNGFGLTYHDRAIRYVREMDRTINSFILKWLVRKDTLRYYTPNSPLFESVNRIPGTGGNQPVPWNQQTMLNNGFQRLAECHQLLGDDKDRVKLYDAIVKASVDWFFSTVESITVQGHVCYQWAYPPEQPIKHVEDMGHGSYDIKGLYRAYRSGRYGITATMMEPFANTLLYVVRQPNGKFVGRMDGSSAPNAHPPGGLKAPCLDLCEFAPELFPIFYDMNIPSKRFRTSPEITSSILCNRERRARLSHNEPSPQPTCRPTPAPIHIPPLSTELHWLSTVRRI